MFVGRADELSFLEDCYASPRAELVVLYGRRRVGKTELLRRFCEGKRHVFYAATEAPSALQLRDFSQRLFAAGAPAGRYLDSYQTWESALRDIDALADEEKALVVIDEFPYLVRGDNSLPSVLQNVWDEHLRSKRVMLVLCGSSMGFIERELLAEKNPLYGRATGILKLQPLPYCDVPAFFPGYSYEDALLAYAVLGGIPHYLAQFDPDRTLADNIKRFVLRRGSALYSETTFLMHQEFRETAVYNSIIQAVALGATQLNEIAQKTLQPAQKASVYLRNLMEVGLVEREFSVGVPAQERAKGQRGLYRICDPFFRFWYAFVFGNLSALEAADVEGVWRYEVEPKLNAFASLPFEDVCRAWLREESKQGRLAFRCGRIGRWWSAADEIDAVGFDAGGDRALIGECKFRNSPVDGRVLSSLRAKGERIGAPVEQTFLFSRGGFTDGVRALAEEDGLLRLVGPRELFEE